MKPSPRTPDKAYRLTIKGNSVAVVSDGTAVLGLGDIGPEAALPVMEGKAMLFKQFADIDAYPICLSTKDPGQIVETVANLSVGFGGINLKDISAPRCFEIEEKLQERLDIPVFYADQHVTAVVVLSIADFISPAELNPESIIPSVFNREMVNNVALAVETAASEECVARKVKP